MGSARGKSENVCSGCDAGASRHCKHCQRSSCVDHQPHPWLCAGCYAEYAQRMVELDGDRDGRTRLARAIPSALIVVVVGFALTKLIVQFHGRPSFADFLFVWIPLACAGGLLVMWLGALLEDSREAQRCARFIDERTVYRKRRRRRRPSTQL